MPTAYDETRATHQFTRYQMLTEEHQKVAEDWIAIHVGEARKSALGPLDLSINPTSDINRQLATPGHYGGQVTIANKDDSGRTLVEQMTEAGYWTRMQRVEYLALGLGDIFVRFDWDERRDVPTYRIVPPHNVWIWCDPSAPDIPVIFWELGLRWDALRNEWFFAWDKFDIRDPEMPTYTIERAQFTTGDDPDVTAQFRQSLDYRWKSKTVGAVLPYIRYREEDTGQAWNHYEQRGTHHGTLNAIVLGTYRMYCALGASGRSVIVVGAEPPAADQAHVGTKDALRTIPVLPGTMYFLEAIQGAQPMVTEVGPGANLIDVDQVASEYEIRQAIRRGLNPADITRQHANPTSGAALAISAKGRREFAARTTPMFRRSDLQAMRLAAIIAREFGGLDAPEDGYAISYAEIPDSPEEGKERRENDQWEVDQGIKSPIDLYIDRHPGATRESALAAIARAKADDDLIAAAVAALAPEATTTPAGGGEADKAQDTALNGAQVESLLVLIGQAASGQIPRDTAIEVIVVSFNRTREEAERLLGKVGTPAFTPTPPTPPTPPPPPAEGGAPAP